MTELSNFNRRILNSLLIVVKQHQGECHGSWWAIADLVQSDMGGPAEDCDIKRMRTHLTALGFEHLTAGSNLAYFKAINGDHCFVEKGLLDEQ